MALRLIKDPSNPLGWSPEIALLGSHGDFYYVHKLVGQGRVSMVARLGELVAYEQAVQVTICIVPCTRCAVLCQWLRFKWVSCLFAGYDRLCFAGGP